MSVAATKKAEVEPEKSPEEEFAQMAKAKVVDEGLAEQEPVLGPPGSNDNGGNNAVMTAK